MTLSAALNVAAKRGLPASPAIHAASPPRRDGPEIPTLSADEVDRLLAAAVSDPREALDLVAALLGVREGELLALTWENVAWPGSPVSRSHYREAFAPDDMRADWGGPVLGNLVNS
jgi:integrase